MASSQVAAPLSSVITSRRLTARSRGLRTEVSYRFKPGDWKSPNMPSTGERLTSALVAHRIRRLVDQNGTCRAQRRVACPAWGWGRPAPTRQVWGQLRGMHMAVSTQRAGCALYEIDPTTGTTIEIFCADRVVAQSFGAHAAGWYWRQRGSPNLPSGPFTVCLVAYRDALHSRKEQSVKGPMSERSSENDVKFGIIMDLEAHRAAPRRPWLHQLPGLAIGAFFCALFYSPLFATPLVRVRELLIFWSPLRE